MSTDKSKTTAKITKKNLSLIRICSETSGKTKDEVITEALEMLYEKNDLHDLFVKLLEMVDEED